MALHDVLPLGLAAATARLRPEERRQEKLARRRTRHRRSILIVAAAVVALATGGAGPLVADHAATLTELAGGIDVMVLEDETTDEYRSIALHLGHMDLYEGEIGVMHMSSGAHGLLFVATTPPSRRTADEVIFRIGRMPIDSLPGRWDDDEEYNNFYVALGSADAFLEMLTMGDRLIYRIGDDTGTFEVPIPATFEEALAFFRRQVEMHGSAEPTAPQRGQASN